jgi:pimeloyl-ACP methyl ester carboxylesterase
VVDTLATFTITVPLISRPAFNPDELGLPFEKVEITSTDHLRLSAWWVPVRGLVLTPRPPVLVVHGLGAAKDFMLNYIVLAQKLGHPVLAVDLRGHGESDKTVTTLGMRESQDLTQWMNFLESRGQKRPILWGHSLGAVSCILAAADDPRAGGLIADAPYDSLRHTMVLHAKLFFGLPEYPLVPLTYWRVGRRLGINPDEIDTIAAIRKVKCPVLILAAESDTRMPQSVVRPIFDAAPEPKQYWVIPHTEHETRSFEPDYRATVGKFLESIPVAP